MAVLDIQLGSKVFGTDGTELGTVTEVWPYTQDYGYISRKNHEIGDSGPIRGTGNLMTSDTGFFEVTGQTALGLANRVLYVPFADVQSVDVEGRVTVASTGDAGAAQYSNRPAALDQAV